MALLAFLWQDHHYTLAKPSDVALNTLTVQICSVDCHTPSTCQPQELLNAACVCPADRREAHVL